MLDNIKARAYPRPMITVSFYFGPGSRYSYLASTQIERVMGETGVAFDWLPIFSGHLMSRAENTYLLSSSRSGQYTNEYRARDVERWAALYGVPYKDADVEGVDWSLVVRACLAAKQLGEGERFAHALYSEAFGRGVMPKSRDDLLLTAKNMGLLQDEFLRILDADATYDLEEDILQSALSHQVFGVPTFVVADAVFWGQDRIPLLIHYLKNEVGRLS